METPEQHKPHYRHYVAQNTMTTECRLPTPAELDQARRKIELIVGMIHYLLHTGCAHKSNPAPLVFKPVGKNGYWEVTSQKGSSRIQFYTAGSSGAVSLSVDTNFPIYQVWVATDMVILVANELFGLVKFITEEFPEVSRTFEYFADVITTPQPESPAPPVAP